MGIPDCLIIAIDGPAGSGKSTLAKGLARELGLTYLDTGATYRAFALLCLTEEIDLTDIADTSLLAAHAGIDFRPSPDPGHSGIVFLNFEDVTNKIRTPEISEAASLISKNPNVRAELVKIQRGIAERLCESGSKGVVVEGRDIGTVVFPDARVKIFLTADLDERTKRRMNDSKEDPNIYRHFADTKAAILSRDISDQTRTASPLKAASDAIAVDNTSWEVSETLTNVITLIKDKIEID